jgi:hypothetical protein
MSASNQFESDILLLLLNNVAIANIGDAAGLRASTTAGSVFVALHSADPAETGNQSTNELSYTGYSRVAVARSAGGWTISGTAPTQAANAAAVTFGACTAGPVTATHFSVGYQVSGATPIIISGALAASLAITAAPSVTPNFPIGTLIGTCD